MIPSHTQHKFVARRTFTFFLVLVLLILPRTSVAATKPNIVLVTLESTRADRVGFLGSKNATPNLDALARQSLVFERAYSQAPLTVVSHATLLSGTYPQSHHASELGNPLAATLPFLPDLLHARGYTTAAFMSSLLLDARNGFAPGFDRGFDVYDTGFLLTVAGETRGAFIEHSGSEVIARANKWMTANAKTPFFVWIHLNDAHASMGASYNRAVTAVDAAVGKLIRGLHAQGLYEDSMVVVVSDHGESLGSHGEDTYGIFLYDETLHVPLIVKLPQERMPGKRVQGHVRLLDVAPTVLEAAGVPVPSQMQGQSLLRLAKGSLDADQPVYSRTDLPQQAFGWSALESWRAGKYLYIRAPKPELYDLSADPRATHNLAQTSKGVLATMAAQLASFDSHFGGAGKFSETGLTSSEMQKLASLGYVGLEKSASGTGSAVLGTDPKDTIAIANKTVAAMLALEQGLREKAASTLRHLVSVQPNAFLVRYGLGLALAEQQKYAQAIEHLHKAIELHPDSTWAQYEMGICLMKNGDFKTSAVHLEIASGQMPNFSGIHSALAQVYQRLGRKEDADRERAKACPPQSK